MAERIQLKEPGSELVMQVQAVRPEVVALNNYYLFSNGKVELLVPQSSVEAQLERLEISDVQKMSGRMVRFGRSEKMSRANRPYWDISWASGAEQSAGGDMGKPTAGNPASAPPADSAKPKMRDAYKSLTEWVLKEVAPIYVEHYGDAEFTPDVAAACVQTLFIQACKSGKVE